MNERIKKLADEATEYANEQNELHGVGYVITFKAKFAELIVEEVYDYILNATFDDEPWPSRKDVKQHFGVEE